MAEYVNLFTFRHVSRAVHWRLVFPALAFFETGSIPYALISHAALSHICFFLFFYIWVRGTLPLQVHQLITRFGSFCCRRLANVILRY